MIIFNSLRVHLQAAVGLMEAAPVIWAVPGMYLLPSTMYLLAAAQGNEAKQIGQSSLLRIYFGMLQTGSNKDR